MKYLFPLILLVFSLSLSAQNTITQYLSGTSSTHTVEWEFYCTKGRNSGEWTSIPVPSCWELQGFGEYNYGHVPFEDRLKEEGLYRHQFTVPNEWKGNVVNIVFEGVMTDAEVKVNGKIAGPIHQGAFYEFRHDISDLLKYGGSNLLEVKVSKHSANQSVNTAERKADYWIFGGIFRPVYLEVLPEDHIVRAAIDANMDGQFTADVYLSEAKEGQEVSTVIKEKDGNEMAVFSQKVEDSFGKKVRISHLIAQPKLWSPEYPNLYEATFLLKEKDQVIHQISIPFGFRTVEVRAKDGIYVNDVKIKFKGVNHHTFHPSYGRTSSKELSIEDVKLCKEMNMNAMRMSHYPPDKHLLDACDSLGLFVLDELAGWQRPPYDDTIGRKLVIEMISRDVHHPSIIIWDNGNEGGWNSSYDDEFSKQDIQKRPLIHPWQSFRLTNTYHYPTYEYLSLDGFARDKIYFPTELLHGLYDGGHGAGLEDYWQKMWDDPLCAGGFLWVFSDEAVERTDKDGALDADGNHAPDGILGPYREKEGSFYTIKEIWSPVFVEKRHITPQFDGLLKIDNRYHYTNLKECTFQYQWATLAGPDQKVKEVNILSEGKIQAPDIAPGHHGLIKIPLVEGWESSDVLYFTAIDPHGQELFTWSWPVRRPEFFNEALVKKEYTGEISVQENDNTLDLSANGIAISINKKGLLKEVKKDDQVIPLGNGPMLTSTPDTSLISFKYYKQKGTYIVVATSINGQKSIKWRFYPNGLLDLEVYYQPPNPSYYPGVSFSYPEENVTSVQYMGDGPYRVWKNRMKGTSFGVWEKKYNNTITGVGKPVYPEFKGYHSNLYWADLRGKSQPGFKVYCHTEDIFLHLFTPDQREDHRGAEMKFPEGDLSLLHGITAIGTKFHEAEQLGPQSMPYFYSQSRFYERGLRVNLTFDFQGD